MERYTSTVQFFGEKKGWGFIKSLDGGKDIFVHYEDIEMDGFKVLKKGQKVSFEIIETDRGKRAKKVRVEE